MPTKIKIDQRGFDQLERFFRACNYMIDGAEKYWWDCYGQNAVIIGSSRYGSRPQKQAPQALGFIAGAQIIIDRVTNTVFELSVTEYVSRDGKGSAYKWYNPAYSLRHDIEAASRGINQPYQAWDDVDYKKTTEEDVMRRITKLFALPKPNPKKKKISAARKLVKAGKRKKAVRRR